MPQSRMSTHETDQTSGSVTWDPNIDLLLAGWCDNAKCFEWMHTEAHSIFESRARQYMIIMNSLTAVAGLSNIIAGGTQIGTFQVSWIFGGLSILVSTLNIIQDKLGYQQASALHQKSANEWATIRAKITEVLTIPYAGRKDCKTFLRYIKADIQAATLEGNSSIPKEIRVACYNRFKSIPEFEIPEICGQMEHTRVFIKDPSVIEASVPLLEDHTALGGT